MNALHKRVVFWGALILLSFLFVSALRIGISKAILMNVGDELAAPIATGLDSERYSALSSQLNIASLLTPADPEIFEQQARLAIFRASAPGIPEHEKTALLTEGATSARQAIKLRPVSPYSWAILLVLKRDLAQYDAEFRLALHKTVELGPWEPKLLGPVADVGLSAWRSLGPDEQDIIEETFVRGLKRDRKLMRQIVTAHENPCAEKETACQ